MIQAHEFSYWLALLHLPQLGATSIRPWLNTVDQPQALFQLSRHELLKLGMPEKYCSYFIQPDWQAVATDLAWLEAAPDHHIITCHDAHYPSLLQQITGSPLLLFVKGDPDILNRDQIALVGSRTPSPTGKETALQFAKQLAQSGLVITSGLALGIDGACHRGALATQGTTIAVLGTGLNQIYPARHQQLAHQIVEQGGALVTEFTPNTPPRKQHFPQRNRLISGMSLGTVVIEASIYSGSLITARYAGEQGREVFAIPGSIHNPMARGCHALIRQGAKLVETTQDIVEELACLAAYHPATKQASPMQTDNNLDESYQHLLQQIDFSPTPIDVLAQRTQLQINEISSMLLILELKGYVENCPQGYILKQTYHT